MNLFEQLEQMRLSYNRHEKIGFTGIIVGAAAVLAAYLGILSALWWIGILVGVGGLVYLVIGFFRYYSPFERIFKNELVRSILAEKIDDLRYSPDEGIAEDVVKETGMMLMGNTYASSDLIEGNYKGVHFSQSDVTIEEITHSGKHTHTETYLQGRWLIFDFNKRFRCDLQVCEQEFLYAVSFGGIFSKGEKLHTLETESVEFNNAFTVAAENDSEAFYILTPHFMEKLLEVRAKIEGDLLFCFVDGKLHVALNDEHDSFEPNMSQPIDAKRIRSLVLGDLELIIELIDILRLDDRIFMTE